VRWDEGVGEREDKEEAECLCPSIFLPEDHGNEEHNCLTQTGAFVYVTLKH